MAQAQPAMATVSRLANSALRYAAAAKQAGVRLGDHYPKEVVDDVFASALKKQTGVSLKYMYVSFILISFPQRLFSLRNLPTRISAFTSSSLFPQVGFRF